MGFLFKCLSYLSKGHLLYKDFDWLAEFRVKCLSQWLSRLEAFDLSACIYALLSLCRARWLTCPDPDAEELFRMVGEVFIFWSKSHVSLSIFCGLLFCYYSFVPLCKLSFLWHLPPVFCVIYYRTLRGRSRTLWWWMRSTTCPSWLLTVRARWARWERTSRQTAKKNTRCFIYFLHIQSCNTLRN